MRRNVKQKYFVIELKTNVYSAISLSEYVEFVCSVVCIVHIATGKTTCDLRALPLSNIKLGAATKFGSSAGKIRLCFLFSVPIIVANSDRVCSGARV